MNAEEERELEERQTLKYGQDLARIYKAEKSKREKLELAYQLLNTIFENTPYALVVLKENLTIQRANTTFAALVELPVRSLVGQPIQVVLPAEEILTALQNSPRSGESLHLEIMVAKPLKRFLAIEMAYLQSGHLSGWILAFHDQTKHKRLEQQKAEFINIAAHELRTPLGAMIGYAEIIRDDQDLDEDAQQHLLTKIVQGGHRLTRIVQEITQFAELNQGDVEDHRLCEFTLSDLIKDILSELADYAEQKQIELRYDLLSPTVDQKMDKSLLRVGLYQLILNGINFNKPAGYVAITLEQNGGSVLIQIADSGLGIPQSELKTIFEPFFQVEDHLTRHIGGLGLGLSIAQRAISQLGGELTVESVVEQGSTFIVKLPVQQTPPTNEVVDLQTQLNNSYQQSLVYAQDIQKLYRQLQQANRQLQEVNLQLDAANKLKSSFLGMISNELRSPFAVINFALQAFPRYGTENLAPEQRDLLEQLKQNTHEAHQRVNHLVDSATLLSKQGRLNLQQVNCTALIHETVATLQAMAQAKGLQLTAQVPDSLVLPMGDPQRIGEALWHLIQNAIKFTPSGGGVITEAADEGHCISLKVLDTGIGIPLDQQDTVWQAFTRLAASPYGVEGLGLGLALVRYVASVHGGDVILESEPGKGSVIGFWIPTLSTQKTMPFN